MTTGDVPDLIRRYFPLDSPTDLSRATGGRITVQSADLYRKGKARFLRLPANETIMGLSDALKLRDDVEVLLAFARSGGQLRVSDTEPLIIRELRMQGGLQVFDHYPAMVADAARHLGTTAAVLLELRALGA